MNRVLSGLKPRRVFEIFEDICAIPHGSGNTKGISDYCVAFAKKRNLYVHQDEHNNIIIKKAASCGYENAEPVALQGHLDMVCAKESCCEFDFEHEGLKLKINGNFISAEGTTLGGDDGIAVATALAILDDNTLKTPPLEVVFTTDEETGMYGANGIDTSLLAAKRFINIDSENEGIFTVGCAGGCRVEIKLPVETETVQLPVYKLVVTGLIGGHSGTEADKGRLNANKVLAEFLRSCGDNIQISAVSGGDKDNAIPTSAECVVFSDVTSNVEGFLKDNSVPTDSGLKIEVIPVKQKTAYTIACSKRIINLLCDLPCGVQGMSQEIENLVETSLNIGVVRCDESHITVTLSLRSSKAVQIEALKGRLKRIADCFGAEFTSHGDYPAWEYRKNSLLRDKMTEVFKSLYGKEPGIEVIHAGLECGIFAERIEGFDGVSIGPDLLDIHTPHERMSINSVQRTYRYICHVLEELG